VTRAVLKIGPNSCLEVSISNHAGLVAALKQYVPSSLNTKPLLRPETLLILDINTPK
jgi:hypothetical protein